jgi:hypothetical protein
LAPVAVVMAAVLAAQVQLVRAAVIALPAVAMAVALARTAAIVPLVL